MEIRKALRTGGIAALVCIAEKLLFGLFGGDQVIAEAVPVLVAFMPPVGIGLLVGSGAYIVFVLLSAKRRKDNRKKMDIVCDLGSLLHVLQRSRNGSYVGEEERQSAKLVFEKYKRWMPKSPDDAGLYARVARISKIMQMYGYKDGMKKVDKEMKQCGETEGA